MARPRKTPEGAVQVEVLRDGVFLAEDVRSDRGSRVMVPADLALKMEGAGLVRVL